jgi:flagellar biosynthesis protein FliQ
MMSTRLVEVTGVVVLGALVIDIIIVIFSTTTSVKLRRGNLAEPR